MSEPDTAKIDEKLQQMRKSFYEREAICSNCGIRSQLMIPVGQLVVSQSCPNCGYRYGERS